MGVVMAKFLQDIEIGPRELPGGLHQYNIYLEGGENRILFISALFPRHRLDNGKRDAHRPGQHTYDHLTHEDGGQIAVQDIIGVDGAVDRPVACETINNKSDQFQGFHKNSPLIVDTRSIPGALDSQCPFPQKNRKTSAISRGFTVIGNYAIFKDKNGDKFRQSDTQCPLNVLYLPYTIDLQGQTRF